MNQVFTLHDFLSFALYLAGILVLVALFIALLNVVKILKGVSEIVEKNQGEIDHTIKTIPSIVDNANEISKSVSVISTDAKSLVSDMKPEVEKIITTVGGVTDTVNLVTRQVDDTSLKVSNTINNISDTIGDTARTVRLNADNAIDYFYIIKEVLLSLKEVFLGK